MTLTMLAISVSLGACDCLGEAEPSRSANYMGNSTVEMAPGSDDCVGPGTVTYRNTVQAIMGRHCHTCHAPVYQAGISGPWSTLPQTNLSTWSEVESRLGAICARVGNRSMPPPQSQDPLDGAEYERLGEWCARAGFPFEPPPPSDLDVSSVATLIQGADYPCMSCHGNGESAAFLFDATQVNEDEASLACTRVSAGSMPPEWADMPLTDSQIQAFAEACGDDYDFGEVEATVIEDLVGYSIPAIEIDARNTGSGISVDYRVTLPVNFPQQLVVESSEIDALPFRRSDEYALAFFYDEDHHDFDGTRIGECTSVRPVRSADPRQLHETSSGTAELGRVPGRSLVYIYACVSDRDNVACAYDDVRVNSLVAAQRPVNTDVRPQRPYASEATDMSSTRPPAKSPLGRNPRDRFRR